MIEKLEWTLSSAIYKKDQTQIHTNNGGKNKQWITNNRTTDLERITAEATGGLKYILVAKSSP